MHLEALATSRWELEMGANSTLIHENMGRFNFAAFHERQHP
jgi:hypothetical protein